jgi:hypothetical protein
VSFRLTEHHFQPEGAEMSPFAEEVMPVIARECGGKVELPERGYNYAA